MRYLSSRRSRELYFFTLFVFQGLVPGFASIALFNFFAAHGVPAKTLSLYVAFIGAPWCLQIFVAPLVDRFDSFAVGKRRAWILFSAAGANLSLLSLLGIDSPLTQIVPIACAFFSHGVFSATLNVACDALIVDQTPEEESARTGAFARSGLTLATAACGALFASLLPNFGFQVCVITLIALSCLVSVAISFTRECSDDKLICWKRKKRTRENAQNWKEIFRSSVSSSRRPVVLKWFCLTTVVSLAFTALRLVFITDVLSNGLLADSTFSQGEAGLYFAIGTIGVIIANWIVKKFGESHAILGALVLSAVLCFVIGVLHLADVALAVWPALILICLAPALLFVAYLPSLMALSKGRVAATQFGAFMAVMMLGEMGGASLFGILSKAGSFAYPALAIVFLASAVFYARHLGSPKEDEETEFNDIEMAS